jgi:hypothetical protein
MNRKKIILIILMLGAAVLVLILFKNCDGVRSDAAQIENGTVHSKKSKAGSSKKADIKEKVSVNNEKKAKIETLDEIKDVYGRVEILSLYDGRSFMGVTISRGEKIEFKTVNGTMYFEAQTVRDTRIIK